MKIIADSDNGIEIETKKSEEFGENREIVVLRFCLEDSSSLSEKDKETITGRIEELKENNPAKFFAENGGHFVEIVANDKAEALARLNNMLRQLLNIDRIRAQNNGKGKLYVGNVFYKTTELELIELFSRAGEVKKVSIITDENGRSRGFAFMEMGSFAEADKAKKTFNGHQFKGRTLVVDDAK